MIWSILRASGFVRGSSSYMPSTPFLATSTTSALDLERALRGDGVGREVRQAGAGAEDDDAALLEVALGAARDVRLGDLGHRDGGLHARLGAGLLEEVLQGERVHDGAEHAHVVGAAAVHAALRELGAAEEVAAADDDRDLDVLRRLGDLAGDAR